MKRAKLCAYCGQDKSAGKMNREHFVPQALWDGKRPNRTRTVPVHVACNDAFTDDNEYFRDIIAAEVGAFPHPEVQKLFEGKLRRKHEHSLGSLRKTFWDLALRDTWTASGLWAGKQPAFSVEWSRIERVLINVMKGIYCSVTGKPIPYTHRCSAYVARDDMLLPYLDTIGRMTWWQDFGDDVFRCRYVFDEAGQVACLMQFYLFRAFIGLAFDEAVAANEKAGDADIAG